MKHFLILLTPILLLLVSCNKHYHYAPNALNVPTVRAKGEMTIEGGLSGGSQIQGVDARFAYSPIKSVVVTSSYMRLKGSFERNNFSIFPTPPPEKHAGQGYLAEAGVGLYRSVNSYTSFSVIGGYGLGRSYNTYDRGRYTDLRFTRAYLQPGVTVQGVLADFTCGLRISYLDFSGRVDLGIDESDRIPIDRIRNDAPLILPDIGFSGGINLSPVRVKCHLTFSLYERNDYYDFSNNNASLSLAFDLHKIFNSGKAKKKKRS